MRKTDQKEIDAVLNLDGHSRFKHFVKRVVDSERAWGLWKDGWALMGTDDGAEAFPLWPAPEYAELCRSGEWLDHEVEEIALNRLIEELLPKLEGRGIRPAVFPTPSKRATTPTVPELLAALAEEAAQYE